MTSGIYSHVSILFISATVFARCCVSPNPPLKPHDRENIRGVLEGSRSKLVQIFGITQLFMAIAECVIVISHALFTPSAFWSRLSRSMFIFEDPQAISNIQMPPLRVLGASMMLVGGLLRLLTFRTLGKFFTFEVGVQKDHRLITAFPYSIVRHPAYAAILLTHPGCLLCSFTPGGWLRESGVLNSWIGLLYFELYGLFVASFPFIMIVRMRQEEEMLKKKFGREWEGWATRVRFMMVPGVY